MMRHKAGRNTIVGVKNVLLNDLLIQALAVISRSLYWTRPSVIAVTMVGVSSFSVQCERQRMTRKMPSVGTISHG